MNRLAPTACLAGVVLLALASTAVATTTAFVGVHVIPMDREVVLRDHTVIVKDEVIVAIGPRDVMRIPDEAQRIDGDGRYLMPGLADMHVHMFSASEGELLIAHGVTFVRNMWGTPTQQALVERAAKGDPDLPTIYTVGELVDGEPPIWDGSAVVTSADEGRAHVRSEHEDGFDAIKVYNRLTRESYDAIVDTARELELDIVGHVPNDVGLEHVLASRQRTIEHLQGYHRALLPDDWTFGDSSFTAYRARYLAQVNAADLSMLPKFVAMTRDAGTWNCPTIIVLDKMMAESSRESEREALMYVDPNTRGWWASITDGVQPPPADDIRTFRENLYAVVRELHRAGCPLLLGSDFPNPWVVPGDSIHDELRHLVNAGLSPFEALRTGTVEPARYMRAPYDFGTVQVGRRADLVLLEDNPLEDIRHTRGIAGVMLRGDWNDAERLADRLRGVVESYAGDGEADPFANADPMPDLGADAIESACSISLGDVRVGAERYAFEPLDDGRTRIVSQVVYNPPFEACVTSDALLDADGRITTIRVRGAVQQQDVDLDVSRDDGTLVIVGSMGGRAIDERRDLRDDVEIGIVGFAFDAYRCHRDRHHTEPTSTTGVFINLFPAFGVTTSTATYEPDTDADLPDGHAAFSVLLDMFGGRTSAEIEIDADGRLETMTITMNARGSIVAKRLDR